jgi:mRNA-degrading endonuclease RelE of RelBE toxin-antitoxin system
MRFEIVLSAEAIEDLSNLTANLRSTVKNAIEKHLRQNPTKTSKSRIKQLRGLSSPQYRLRVDEVRVFYDVAESTVEVLAIVDKVDAGLWLEQAGQAYTETGDHDEENTSV